MREYIESHGNGTCLECCGFTVLRFTKFHFHCYHIFACRVIGFVASLSALQLCLETAHEAQCRHDDDGHDVRPLRLSTFSIPRHITLFVSWVNLISANVKQFTCPKARQHVAVGT